MAKKIIGLHTHIWNNNLLSLIMLCVLPITLSLLTVAVYVLWFLIMAKAPFMEALNHSFALMQTHAPILLSVVGIWYAIAWVFNREIILKATGAKSVSRQKEKRLYNLLENLAISRSLPMPQLAIIETSALNAFASGIDKSTYTVTVTRGLMAVLDDDELEAVLAHELSHIQNNDVRLMVIISIFAGMIGIIHTLAKSFLFSDNSHHSGYGISSHRSHRPWYSRSSRSSNSNGDNNSGQFIIFIFAIVAVSFLASVASNYIKLYISRRREFMADAGAVKLTRNPAAMVRALRKIEGESSMPSFPAAVAEMCISPSAFWEEASSTHPTTDSRVEALKAIAGHGLSEEDYAIDSQALRHSIDKAHTLNAQSSDLLETIRSAPLSPSLPLNAPSNVSNNTMSVGVSAPAAVSQAISHQQSNTTNQSNKSPSSWQQHLKKSNESTTVSQGLLENRLGKTFGTRSATKPQSPTEQPDRADLAGKVWGSSAGQQPKDYAEVYLNTSSTAKKEKKGKKWGNSSQQTWPNITSKFQPN